jgi:long-chain fatty acid transport protein
MRSGRVLSLALGAAAVLAPARAVASPEDLFGYGGRTSAMGATGAAHAIGYESAGHNPALASTIRENKLSLGYGGGTFALEAGGRVSTPAAKGIFAGAALPLPFGGTLADRIGVALAFYTPSDVIVRGRVL